MRGRGIKFNGIQMDAVQVIELTVGRVAPVRRNTLEIAGRAGGVSQGYDVGVRPISAVVEFESFNKTGWLDMLDDITAWLISETPQELEFEQEPGRMYMAEFEGTIDTKEINLYGQITLNWICVDPHVYKNQTIEAFEDGIATIPNTGSAAASPVYEIDVLEDITHLDIISDKAYFRIGEPAPIDEPVYERQTLILNDTMKTLTGWTVPQDVDNGYIAGTMVANQTGFEATSFGAAAQPLAWQGPAMQRTLPEPLQNFRIDVLIDLLNVSRETGMIEIYLMDAFDNVVAKIGLEDVWPTVKRNQAKFQLGNVGAGRVSNYRTANYAPAWNDFKGMIRLYRDGNRFRPYFAQIKPDGKHDWVSSGYVYTDIEEEYLALVTKVKVTIRKWPGSSTSQAVMKIRGLKVWRLNDPLEGLPVMATEGDKIVVDTREGVVMINGEVEEGLKDHFSDYFDLPSGQTTLVIQPEDKVSGTVTIRERSL